MLDEQKEIFAVQPHTVGADKGYHNREFVQGCREKGIIPHVAPQKNRQVPGLDGRTTATPEYAVSQKVRKRVEEIFGWVKTVGGFRKSRVLGIQRTQMEGYWVAAALQPGATWALGDRSLRKALRPILAGGGGACLEAAKKQLKGAKVAGSLDILRATASITPINMLVREVRLKTAFFKSLLD